MLKPIEEALRSNFHSTISKHSQSGRVKPNPALAKTATLSIDKDVYYPNENIMVTVVIHDLTAFVNGMSFGIHYPMIDEQDNPEYNHDYLEGSGRPNNNTLAGDSIHE